MRSILVNIRRGRGPFWGTLKRLIRGALTLHLPADGPLRPLWRAMYGCHVLVREGWAWCQRFFWNEPLFRSQCASVGSGFRMEQLPYMQGHGQIIIDAGVQLSGKPSFAFNNRCFDRPELRIGKGTFIGHACSFRVGRSVTIGRHCLVASGVSIGDYDGHPLDADQRRAGETLAPHEVRPVVIGDDVWIGTGSLILKGVTIGDRVIVGAKSVVTKDVPSDAIVAGNPARVASSADRGGNSRIAELAAEPRAIEPSPDSRPAGG